MNIRVSMLVVSLVNMHGIWTSTMRLAEQIPILMPLHYPKEEAHFQPRLGSP